MKKELLIISILLTAAALSWAYGPGRKALVVGNAAYRSGPPANPGNDAEDMAAVLADAGFEVMLRTDRTLADMEGDLREFRSSIEKGDVALFFYAGHGVQVDGINYLLPVDNADIRDNLQLKRRAVDAITGYTIIQKRGKGLNG